MPNIYREHVYSLEAKNESEISPLWRILQVVFYICCIVFGFAVTFGFSYVMHLMDRQCILYADITLELNQSLPIVKFDDFESYCNIVIFIPIIITVFGCFFMVLFVMCGRGGTGNQNLPDTWRIVIPTIIFNFISFCFALYIANTFQRGLQSFFQSIAHIRGVKSVQIKNLGRLYIETGTKPKEIKEIGLRLSSILKTTKHFIWMLVSFWGMNLVWIVLRCIFIVDFQLIRTTINVYPKNNILIQRPEIELKEFSLDTENPEKSAGSDVTSYQSAVQQQAVNFNPSTGNASVPLQYPYPDKATKSSNLDNV